MIFFLSITINFILFLLLLKKENIHTGEVVYIKDTRELYIDALMLCSFRERSSNHQLFEFILNNKSVTFHDIKVNIFPHVDKNIKKSIASLRLPSDFIILDGDNVFLSKNIKTR
ncbi:hypothetical protein BTO23_20520 [Aliivibrio sifiae]|uniref:Uncharacterized protein n=1 Tax=Aliivibrio sifiae TaxID=566293 RepID=A0A2S7X112_9GAMM|nr:hypothetical protein BTO23_20520 [Aliivibrio sifiae]GLR76839.1 hypothetical protein GCM10007855_37140 [Aliivibrio sifiae]